MSQSVSGFILETKHYCDATWRNTIDNSIVSCNEVNMSAFLLFDPQNSLIFVHCGPKFEPFLLESSSEGASHWPPDEGDDLVRNLFTLHLTPIVSVYRQLATAPSILPSLADTYLALHQWQQFIFVSLYKAEPSEEEDIDDDGLYFLLQRKVSLFARLTFFLYGYSLYNIDKHEHNLKVLLKMLNTWDSLSNEPEFLLEVQKD